MPENLDNNGDPKRDIIDVIYRGSSKGEDLLSKLGVWRPWERVEEEGGDGGVQRKMYSSIKSIKEILKRYEIKECFRV